MTRTTSLSVQRDEDIAELASLVYELCYRLSPVLGTDTAKEIAAKCMLVAGRADKREGL